VYFGYPVPSVLIYLVKGDEIQSDVLSSERKDDGLIILLQIVVFVKVTVSFDGFFSYVMLTYIRGVVEEFRRDWQK
jgi:hypothetical protein